MESLRLRLAVSKDLKPTEMKSACAAKSKVQNLALYVKSNFLHVQGAQMLPRDQKVPQKSHAPIDGAWALASPRGGN